ncbi:MAG: bifunctional nuclease family protein [Anaerolineae bacterium]|nr:bifunctional nuclease family protein [Anaerolineae bacterium]
MIPVTIESVRVSLVSQQRVVILAETGGDRYLPIFIGAFEADAITVRLQGAALWRPMTHDLLLRCISQLGGEVLRVVITELRNDTFFANIHVRQNGEEHAIDSRPSDALALAIRAGVPVYVSDAVMDQAGGFPDPAPWLETPAETSESPEEDVGIFRDFIDSMDLGDLEE